MSTQSSAAAAAFRATIELGGKTATGIEVPPEVVAALGTGRRPPVRVTLAGYEYRSNGRLDAGALPATGQRGRPGERGVAAGDEVDVQLALDTDPREVIVPADFAAALDADARASSSFDAMSYSHKLRWVLSIDDAKTDATRQRRIAKAVETLRKGR